MSYRTLVLTVLVGMLMLPTLAFAQGGGGGGGGGGGRQGGGGAGGGGGRGNFDPAQMRQRYMDNIKEQMNATEDEWKVISPKLEKLMTVQRESRGGGGNFGGRGGRGGRGGDNADTQDQSKIAQAQADLRRVLEDKGATAEEISKRLTALRDARAKAREDLAAAQKELKELLTQRQEGVCVLMGFLE